MQDEQTHARLRGSPLGGPAVVPPSGHPRPISPPWVSVAAAPRACSTSAGVPQDPPLLPKTARRFPTRSLPCGLSREGPTLCPGPTRDL